MSEVPGPDTGSGCLCGSLLSAISSNQESSAQGWQLLLARAAEHGPTARPLPEARPSGKDRGVDEGAAAVVAGGTGPASFWISRLCIREQKLTLCQDLGSLQHQRCSSRREGLQKWAHLALQSQAGAGRELPCTDPPHGTHRSLFQGHWSVSSHSECPLAVQEL